MGQENTQWLNETWRFAVKRIAPHHAVDADELLGKVPNLFSVSDVNQQQKACELLLRTGKMTVAERRVCLWASQFVQDVIRKEIHRIHLDLVKFNN